MPLNNIQEANAYLRELREQREAYKDFAEAEVLPLFDEDERREKPPGFFVDSSFLYTRSFDGDDGSRPFANQVFWLSPDMHVAPLSNLAAYTRTLNAGETYNLSCVVHNRGDMTVPSAKVEFWLGDPTLGFDTRFATHLTLGSVPTAWVNSNSTAVVNYAYTVPPTEAGHKCLFARIFSFSPLDLPINDFALDPRIDRHVAQLNLNIVAQGEPFVFNLIHAPNDEQIIAFVPLAREELLALRRPVLADVTPFADFPRNEWAFITEVEMMEQGGEVLDFARENNALFVVAKDANGIDIGTWRGIRDEVKQVLAAVEAGRTRMSEHRDLLAAFREINGQAQRSTFQMRAPDLGLEEGQAVAVHIRASDAIAPIDGEIFGGLTLLIVGG